MRFTLIAALLFGPTAFAQHRPGAAGAGAGVRSGVARSGVRRTYGGGAVYVPYPVYGAGYGFDGFYATDYASGYGPGPYGAPPGNYDPAYGYDPGAPYGGPTPTVIINQNFQTDSVRPQLRDYSNVPLPPPGAVITPPATAAAPPAPASSPSAPPLADDQPTIFLIAMQDHTIIPVIAYWVQGDTLNYISLKSVPNHVSLALIDRDFSKQLNAERNVPFALPAPR